MKNQKLLNNIISQLNVPIEESQIRSLANQLWIDAGSPSCDGIKYWLDAEEQLKTLNRNAVAKTILAKVLAPVVQESVAKIQDETKLYTHNVIDVLKKDILANQQQVLPDGVRFHKKVGRYDYLVVEHKPMVRTLLVDTSYHQGKIGASRYPNDNGKSKQYRIALPYVIYQITLKDFRYFSFKIAFKTQPLKTLRDDLCLCILPNSHETGDVCCPFGNNYSNNIVDAVNDVIGYYWQSQYRYCLHKNFPDHPAFRTWENWEAESEKNPLFVLNVKWTRANFTMNSFLTDVIQNNDSVPSGVQEISSKFLQDISKILNENVK